MRRTAARALWRARAVAGDGATWTAGAGAGSGAAPAAAARGSAPAAALAMPAARCWTTAGTAASRAHTHPQPPHARFARVSAPAAAAVEVRVAAMGESITEGTVAAVLAPPGTAVEEDAVIAQIETDKVTIDVRAPAGGIVQQVLVKPEETVVVGQLVAILGDEALEGAPAVPAPAPAAAAVPGNNAAPAAVAAPPAPAGATAHARAPPPSRVPSIHFPARRTAGGDVISFLPAAAQAAARAARLAGLGSSPSDTKWYAGKERGVKLAPSGVLSEAEIELIESGGAW